MATIYQAYVGPLPVMTLSSFLSASVTVPGTILTSPTPVVNIAAFGTSVVGTESVQESMASSTFAAIQTLTEPIVQRGPAAGGGTSPNAGGPQVPTTGQLYPLGGTVGAGGTTSTGGGDGTGSWDGTFVWG